VTRIDDADVIPLVEAQRTSFRTAGRGLLRSWPPSDALDVGGFVDLLSRRYGVLGTTRPDGRPHVAPVAFVVAKGALWVATVAGGRLRNLRRSPYASMVVMEGEGGEHRAILVEGPVALHDPSPDLRRLWEARMEEGVEWAAAFVELGPERVFSHAARASLR